jgi:hypothetical protein
MYNFVHHPLGSHREEAEASSSNSTFSPSILAFSRLRCQPIINGGPLESQMRHSHSLGAQTHSIILICNIGPDSSRRPTQLLYKGVLSLLLTLRKASGTDRTREI